MPLDESPPTPDIKELTDELWAALHALILAWRSDIWAASREPIARKTRTILSELRTNGVDTTILDLEKETRQTLRVNGVDEGHLPAILQSITTTEST